jgi:uncharacterized NAD(P)/FAD-binding protein YdhS
MRGDVGEQQHRTTAIIGGAASGLLAAIHLARETGPPRRVIIFEPGSRLGAGAAYSTDDPRHLLNVPARCMSAFDDRPADLVRWLDSKGLPYGGDDFVPRMHYREYLTEAFERTRRRSTEISWVRDAVVAVGFIRRERHRMISLELSGGRHYLADEVVLAIGAPAPSVLSRMGLEPSGRVVTDPWQPGALSDVPKAARVLLVGTGLSMVDVAVSLGDSTSRKIHARSRTGLLPATHEPTGFTEWPDLRLDQAKSARDLVRCFRQSVTDAEQTNGWGWRNVVSAARRCAPDAWRRLPPCEQARLMRHAGRLWDSHRHRMSPEVARTVDSMRSSGLLDVGAGRIEATDARGSDGPFEVAIATKRCTRSMSVDVIVDCSGPNPDPARGSGLMRELLVSGVVRPHPSGVGIDVDPHGRVRSQPGMFVMGWYRRGESFESTAIPELRIQAARLAKLMVAEPSSSDQTSLGVAS